MSSTPSVSSDPQRARARRDHVARPLEQPFAELLAGRALLAAGHTVLELTCGGGLLAPRLSGIVGERGAVTAVDPDAAELALAEEASDEGTPGVTWRRAEAADLPFEAASFDAALSSHGFGRLPDPQAALAELRRVLRIGGRVSLGVWAVAERNPFFAAVSETLDRHLDGTAAEDLAAYRREFTLGSTEQMKELLEAAGFVMVSAEEQRLDIELPALEPFLAGYLHASGLGEPVARLDTAARDTLLAELRAAVEARLDGGTELPFRSVLAFGRTWRS